jgi:hypothetical protein
VRKGERRGTYEEVVVVVLEFSRLGGSTRAGGSVGLGRSELTVCSTDLFLHSLPRSDFRLGLRDTIGEERIELQT